MAEAIYTAISFAPVQGFIEKSRKLRDLFGASLILSYLSQKIIQDLQDLPDCQVISPALIHQQKGMPNRILLKGQHIERTHVQNVLLKHWQHLLRVCREWVEEYIPAEYHWAQTSEQVGKEKGEWERWGSYAWEVFWGTGDSPQSAMEDLETRKLKRDWTAINWVGESSSLSGADAIAWPRLGEKRDLSQQLTPRERQQRNEEQELFYRRLSWLLDDPQQRIGQPHLTLDQLREYEARGKDKGGIGRYIAVNERLSIPELVKRLITYDRIDDDRPQAEKLDIEKLKNKSSDPKFKDIYREVGYWTGWFMGDGDKVGDKLKLLADSDENDLAKRDRNLERFSELVRGWGEDFENREDLFEAGKGRVIYAGGDDFLGVLYSEELQSGKKPEKLKPIDAWDWLLDLPKEWQELQQNLADELDFKGDNRFTYSVGFVWAGHQVPQRDILQHCRDAERRAKSLGRDRVTIRVLFNSGQYVQWTCPWDYLDILTKYRDRNHCGQKTSSNERNWNHLYGDWEALKARHAIQLKPQSKGGETDENAAGLEIAVELINLYFAQEGERIQNEWLWEHLVNETDGHVVTDYEKVNWLNDLVQVGWQLCRNSSL